MTRTVAVLAVTLVSAWVAVTQIGALYSAVSATEPERQSFSRGAEARRPIVRVAQTEVTRFVGTTTGFTVAEAPRRVAIFPPVAGDVREVAPALQDGAPVARGDFLFALDPTDAQRLVDEADVALIRARAESAEIARRAAEEKGAIASEETLVEIRRAELSRIEDLRSRGGGTEQQRDAARVALLSAEQSLSARRSEADALRSEAALANLATIDAERARDAALASLDALVVTAPLTGRFEGDPILPGARMAAGEAAGTIVDTTRLEVRLALSPREIARLGALEGRAMSLTRQGDGRVFSARIDRRSTQDTEDGTTRVVLVALADPDPCLCLQPGDHLAFLIPEAPLEPVVILPTTAVSTDGRLLTLGPDDRLEDTALTVLRRVGGSVIAAVPSGAPLSYVTTRAPGLGAGIRVRPRALGEDSAASTHTAFQVEPAQKPAQTTPRAPG